MADAAVNGFMDVVAWQQLMLVAIITAFFPPQMGGEKWQRKPNGV